MHVILHKNELVQTKMYANLPNKQVSVPWLLQHHNQQFIFPVKSSIYVSFCQRQMAQDYHPF